MLFGAGGLPRHSGDQVGAQVPSPDCLTLRLASNRIPTFRWDIYSAVTFVTEAIRTKKYLTPINRILRSHLPARVRLTDPQRATLAAIGNRLGRQALEHVAMVAKPG